MLTKPKGILCITATVTTAATTTATATTNAIISTESKRIKFRPSGNA